MATRIRPPALAGQWYPADAAALRRSVTDFLENADSAALGQGRPAVVVAPHAGHAWSGETAGRALGLLAPWDYDRIVLMAPNHRWPLSAPSCPEESAFATPLGDVALDVAARDLLLSAGVVASVPEAHAQEHAVEIQLPFLQALWDEVPPVLPILVPRMAAADRARLALALGRWCDGRTLFFVSTDFTHYGVDYGYVPFVDDIPRRLEDLDMGAVERILAWDGEGLQSYARETGITMCGVEAMGLAMALPWPAAPAMTMTGYQRSGDRDDDYAFSVSYVGMIGTIDAEERP